MTELGAQVAPDIVLGAFIRLKLFTVGLVTAAKAEACFIIPPRKCLPFSDNPSSEVWLSVLGVVANTFIFDFEPGASQTDI